jgi:hypothetical protein
MLLKTFSGSILLCLLSCTVARAQPAPVPQQWGTILGRIVYDGEAPKPRTLPIPAKRVNAVVPDETLVVGPSGGLANVFVYVKTSPLAIHPSYPKR